MWVHAMDQYADIFEKVKPRMDTVEVSTSVPPPLFPRQVYCGGSAAASHVPEDCCFLILYEVAFGHVKDAFWYTTAGGPFDVQKVIVNYE